MPVISAHFLVFFSILFGLYWAMSRAGYRLQNLVLLLAGYFFYGYWSFAFLLLLVSVSVCNFFLAILIDNSSGRSKRKLHLLTGLILNIGNLAIFKYFDFFSVELADLFNSFGIELGRVTLTLVVPLGISFYTFLAISYLVDVYRKKTEAGKDPVSVLLALSFFPIIISGPIHRPGWLLPQIVRAREFNDGEMASGLRQILWGLVTKLVIADNLAPVVNEIFTHPEGKNGALLLMGVLFFAVQVYADFSGYSDIAIGISRLLGFQVIRNFAYPYFAGDIAEFWKRWHISLTTWFRDYLYIPVAYFVSNRLKKEKYLGVKTEYLIYAIGLTVTWFITGLWHGASFTFIAWGVIHGVFLFLFQVYKKPRKRLAHLLEIKPDHLAFRVPEYLLTMFVVLFSYIFFRADSMTDAIAVLRQLPDFSGKVLMQFLGREFILITLVVIFFMSEWNGRAGAFTLDRVCFILPRPIRWSIYLVLICIIVIFAPASSSGFLYFKF